MSRRSPTKAKVSRRRPADPSDRGPSAATIQRQLSRAFAEAWQSFSSGGTLLKKPRIAGIEFHVATSNYLIQVTYAQPHRIQVSRRFTHDLSAEFRSNWRMLRSSCLTDATAPVAARLWPEVGESIVQLSTSFVVFHELFHVLNGHTAYAMVRSKGKPRQLAFGEAAQKVAREKKGKAPPSAAETKRMLEAYYLELEADDTALQWMMQGVPLSPALVRLVELVSGQVAARDIAALDNGWGRVLAFRAMIAALVVTVRLLERQRGDETRTPALTHPYPMARLFAGAFTVMEQFADITRAENGGDGAKIVRLSADEAEDLDTFLRMIARPIVSAPWAARDSTAADDGFEVLGPLVVTEIKNIILGRNPETEPVSQLLRIQRLRKAMTKRLARHRCMGPVIGSTPPPAN